MYNYKITLLLSHKYIQNLERNVDGDIYIQQTMHLPIPM